MTEADKLKVKRCVVAAIYKVCSLGSPPEGPAEVEKYLETTIRVVLGINATASQRKKVAKLIAVQTNSRIRPEFGIPANVIIARYNWLFDDGNPTLHDDDAVSTFADKVEAAIPAR